MSVPVSRLGDQTTIIMGQSPPGGSYNRERTGMPLLNGPTEFGPIHPTEKQWTTAPTKLCEPGDALFCVRGATAGRLNVADKTYCLGRGLAAIRGKPGKFDAGFLLHILRNGYAKFQALGVGSTFINISSEELSKFEVPALPLTEQRRIAEILDRAEALRAKRRAALNQLGTLTQSIFLDLFGDPTHAGKWPTYPISEIAASERYAIVDGPFGSSIKPSDYTESGVPVIRIGNITRDGHFLADNLLYVSKSKFDSLKRSSIRANDVLVSRVGTIGNTCIFPAGIGDALLSTTGVCKITANVERMSPVFLHYALRMPSFQEQIHKSASTSVQKYFNLTALKGWKIIVPPIQLQHDFCRRIDAMKRFGTMYHRSLAEMDAFFAVLQHRAFRGEL